MTENAEPPRFAEERRARILDLVRQRGRLEVLELARSFKVSEHTIRRDLNHLHAEGVLQKTHGGAVVLDTSRMNFEGRAAALTQAKGVIGTAAASLIEPGQSVIIDASSTTLLMARALKARPLTVITNTLDVALLFDRDPEVQLVITGGTWNARARGFLGPATRDLLAQCRADWAVLGACALDARRGVTATDESDAAVKRAMVAAASRTMVLADHSKQHNVAPFVVASWEQVHALVTDRPWPEIDSLGVAVHVAAG